MILLYFCHRKQRRLLRLLTRLDRQLSPPPTSRHDQQTDEGKNDITITTSDAYHAPPPSWLRSESTVAQDSHSISSVFDDSLSQRPVRTSDRSSGVRRGVLSQRVDSFPELSTTSRPNSRPVSGRMSGIRGELCSRQNSCPPSGLPLASSSDPHLPTFLDRATESISSLEPQRLQTAVIAQGRRTIPLNSSGSNTCLVPSIDDDVMATPTLSHGEPNLSSTNFDLTHPRPLHLERQSINECLESISKFDHLHLGQISSNMQGIHVHARTHTHCMLYM